MLCLNPTRSWVGCVDLLKRSKTCTLPGTLVLLRYVALFLDISAISEFTSWYWWLSSSCTSWAYDDIFYWPTNFPRAMWRQPGMSTSTSIYEQQAQQGLPHFGTFLKLCVFQNLRLWMMIGRSLAKALYQYKLLGYTQAVMLTTTTGWGQ